MAKSLVVLGLLAAVTLAGCSDGSPGTTSPTPSPAPSSISASPVPVPDGVAAAQDLADFLCTRRADGTWTATGSVVNSTKKPADYLVTVFAGAAGGAAAPAQNVVVSAVAAGATAPFAVPSVPAAGDAPTCFARLIRLG